MLWISKSGRWELSIDPMQWALGFNIYRGFNVFLLCVRIGYNDGELASVLRKGTS